MNRRTALGILAILLAVAVPVAGGFSYSARTGTGGTHVAAHLSPLAIGAWPFALLVVLASWRQSSASSSAESPAWYRVLIALYVDCLLYLVVAIAVLLGVISDEETTARVAARSRPGFGLSQDAEKRWDDAEFEVGMISRALDRLDPKEALSEVMLGERRVSNREIADLKRDVSRANAIMDELAVSEDINAEPALWPKIDELEQVVASLWAPLEGWASFKQSLLVMLGTDRQGRSIAARAFYSIKVAIQIGIVVGLFAVVFGSLLGAAAAYYGGWVDHVVIWLYSTLSSIPGLVLLGVWVFMFTGTELEGGLIPLFVAFGLTFWIGPCRVIRGEALRLKELDYVQAATAIGQKRGKILLKHIIPNVSHLIFVNFSLLFIGAIKSEVILTFLGLGVKDQPSWGIMISQSKHEVVNDFFWQIGSATALMFFLVLAFNIFTDALQDALDPKHIG